MIPKTQANPVELAVAAAFVSGQIDAEGVQAYAQTLEGTLRAEGVSTDGWQSAVIKWTGASQNGEWRAKAHEVLGANRDLLRGLAQQVEEIARIPAAGVASAHPAAMEDWLLQQGLGTSGEKLSPSAVVGDSSFLDAGRFAGFPTGTVPPASMQAGDKRSTAFPVPIDSSALEDPGTKTLSQAMTRQWSFIQERGIEGGENINTLTRHAYNQFGVQQILENLEAREVTDGRVLLVTGYETPIEDLLDSDRVKEVVVADLSENAAQVVAEKYAHHPNARKLKIKIADFSGISLETQAEAAAQFAQHAPGEVPAQATKDYFTTLTKPDSKTQVPFSSGEFDAVHLPFVTGSLHFGPITAAMGQHSEGYMGYDDFLGPENLATEEAAQAAVSTMKHAFDEAQRISKEGGLVVANMWARPQPDSDDAPIRLSDTPVSLQAFDALMDGMTHRFSGNPQPGLPHTVGHIFASTKQS